MRLTLHPHPDCRGASITRIEAEVMRLGPDHLTLHYFLFGNLSEVRIPPTAAPGRVDRLWRHTCLEAFLRGSADQAYYELNFAPSGRWAAYRFSGYRKGMEDAAELGPPRIESRFGSDTLELRAEFEIALAGPWQVALAAVIEEKSGRKSYWALAHPPGEPDFHHSDCFAFELPAAKRP